MFDKVFSFFRYLFSKTHIIAYTNQATGNIIYYYTGKQFWGNGDLCNGTPTATSEHSDALSFSEYRANKITSAIPCKNGWNVHEAN